MKLFLNTSLREVNEMDCQEVAIRVAKEYLLENRNKTDYAVGSLYVMWFSKIYKDWKCLVAGDRIKERLEITYDGDNCVIYIDCSVKEECAVIRNW